jgi:hypothetical protein
LDAGVLFVYAGLSVGLAGICSLAIPLRFLGIRTRRAGALASLAGFVLVLGGISWPASLHSSRGVDSRLHELLPEFQFREFHEVLVRAPAQEVFRAIRPVTAREIRFFRLLTWLRSPRVTRARESIVAPPPDQPLLEVALRTGFALLAEEPGREIVFGTMLCGGRSVIAGLSPRAFASFSEPGFCKVAMNFRIAGEAGGLVRLTTETRVLALGDSTRRQFAAYWRVIFPGSAFIRRMWLEAIRRRAESPRPSCLRELESFAGPVDKALARFEAAGPPEKAAAAAEVLRQTRLLREDLERAPMDERCAASRREILIFFNHVLIGFEGYLARDPPTGAARTELDSILRRGRAHESRGLEAN